MSPLYSYSRTNEATVPEQELVDATKEVQQMEQPISQTSEQTAQAVIGHFGNVVANFFTMLQDPNNPQHVVNSISGMIGSMANIVIEGIKRGEISINDDQEAIEQWALECARELEDPVRKRVLSTLSE